MKRKSEQNKTVARAFDIKVRCSFIIPKIRNKEEIKNE